MDEVKDGELVKWTEPGTHLGGILLNYRTLPTPKGQGHVYNVETSEGEKAFFAPTLLQQKLAKIPVGSVVDITFVEEKKTNSGNTSKIFKVLSGVADAKNLASVGLSADMKEVSDNAIAKGQPQAQTNSALADEFEGDDVPPM